MPDFFCYSKWEADANLQAHSQTTPIGKRPKFKGAIITGKRTQLKPRFPLPELTDDRFPLPVNMGRVDGRNMARQLG